MNPQGAIQNALNPTGPQAANIHDVWQVFLWTSVAVYVVVIAFVIVAVLWGRHQQQGSPAAVRASRTVVGATVLSTTILFGLLTVSAIKGHALSTLPMDQGLRIRLTGHQWWWDAVYLNSNPSQQVRTANEIHIPVGRPVRLELASADVIHSFWVPNLHGKTDLLPGDSNVTLIRADQAGVYRGQCAEFCGLQHAHMALLVIAEPEDQFKAWYQHQLEDAMDPTDPVEMRGQDLVVGGTCATCHTIRGTTAGARFAPDLTHVASRRTIGAVTLGFDHSNVQNWIRNPQDVKPGNNMPPAPFGGADLEAVVRYVESLR